MFTPVPAFKVVNTEVGWSKFTCQVAVARFQDPVPGAWAVLSTGKARLHTKAHSSVTIEKE